MDRLTQKNKQKVIDLLTERLSFERTSVKLYDKILERISRMMGETLQTRRRSSAGDYSTYGLSGYGDDVYSGMHEDIREEVGGARSEDQRRAREREERVIADMLPRMQTHRDQEIAHEEWLEDCIRKLGGNTRRATELSKLSAREISGIEAVIMKDPELPHLLHALLAAEHVDFAGWDLLVALADAAGDLDAKTEFEKRLHEEEQHLVFVRDALRTFSAHEVLQADLQSPSRG